MLLAIFLFSTNSMAWECGKLTDHHDLVAEVKIEKENSKYVAAFDAKVEKIIYRHGEEDDSFSESHLSNLKIGSSIIVLESKLDKKQREDGRKLFKAIRTDSCMKAYEVGQRIRLFSKIVEPNIFRSSSNWTKRIE